jgi:putative endonuclease
MKKATDIGRDAEYTARQYLEKQGLKLIESNYRCRYGEIDLIMQDKHGIVFIEVRYRSNNLFGSGAESVDFRKQQKLLSSASHFLQSHKQLANQSCRFDVISLSADRNKNIDPSTLQWITNAIEA